MTAAEQASLEALRSTVEEGFREIRDLMEKRRDQELQDHGAFRDEIESIKTSISNEAAVKTAADQLWGRLWKLSAFLVSSLIGASSIIYVLLH